MNDELTKYRTRLRAAQVLIRYNRKLAQWICDSTIEETASRVRVNWDDALNLKIMAMHIIKPMPPETE